MKKFSKMLTVGLATIFVSTVSVSAKEMSLNNLDSILPPDETYVFVIGDYLYTNDSYAGITSTDYAHAIHSIVAGEGNSLTYYGLVKQEGGWTVAYAFLDGKDLTEPFRVLYVDNDELPNDDPNSLLEYYVEDLGTKLTDYLDVNNIVESEDILAQAKEVYDRAIAEEKSEEEALNAAKDYITNEISNALKSKLATDLTTTYNEGVVAEDGKALDTADYETYSAVLSEGSEATIDEMLEAYNNALSARYVLADVIDENKGIINTFVESLNKEVLEHADETYYNAVKTTIDDVLANIGEAQNKTEVLSATEAGKSTITEALRTKVLKYLEDVYNTNYEEVESDTVLVMTEAQYKDYAGKIASADIDNIISLYEEVVGARTEMTKEVYETVNAHMTDVLAKFESYATGIEVSADAKDAIESTIRNATSVAAIDEAYKTAVKDLALAALESYNGGATNYTQKATEYSAALETGKATINAVDVTEGYEEAVKSALETATTAIDEIDDDTTLEKAKVVAELTEYVKKLQGNDDLTGYLPDELENAVENLKSAIANLNTAADVQTAYNNAVDAIVSGVREKVVAKLDEYKGEKVVSNKIMLADDYARLSEEVAASNDPVEIVGIYTNATTDETEDYVLISKTAYDAQNAIEKANAAVALKDNDYTIDVTDEEGNENRYHNVPEYNAAKKVYEDAIKEIEDSFGTELEKTATDVKNALDAFNTALESIDSDLECEKHNVVDGDYTDLYNSLVNDGKYVNGEKIGSYGTTQKGALYNVFSQQKPIMRKAENLESLKSLYDEAVEALMAVKTDEEVFADAKTKALTDLATYYEGLITSEVKHYTINGTELSGVYETQRGIINGTKFVDEETAATFETLLSTAKTALDAVEDDGKVTQARTNATNTIESAITSLKESIGAKAGTSKAAKGIVDTIFDKLLTDISKEIEGINHTSELTVYSDGESYVRSKAKPLFRTKFVDALKTLYNAGEMNADGKVLKLEDYNTAMGEIDTDATNMGSMVRAYVTAEQALVDFDTLKEELVSALTTALDGLTAAITTENTSLSSKNVKDLAEIAAIIESAKADEFASEVTNEASLVQLISTLKRSVLDKFIEIIETEIAGYRDNYDAAYYVAGSYINTTYEGAVNEAVTAYESDENLNTALQAIATAYDSMMQQATKKGA